jgi:hypothetical protein
VKNMGCLADKNKNMTTIDKVIADGEKQALDGLYTKLDDNKYPILLLASYCGGDNIECTEELPCIECLKMCNIAIIPKELVTGENVIGGYDFLVDAKKNNPSFKIKDKIWI